MEVLITPEQMAERWNVEVSTVMEWNRKYDWPHARIGHQVRWTEDQYAEIERRHTVRPKRPAGPPGQTKLSIARQAR